MPAVQQSGVTKFTYKEGAFHVQYALREIPYNMPLDHEHSSYELYYLFTGRRKYFIDNRVYIVEKGDLVFIPKYSLHRTLDCGIASHERIMLQFNESLLEGLYGKNNDAKLLSYFCNIMPTLHLNTEDRRVVEGLLYRMMKELKERAIGHEVYLKTLTVELLLYLLRCKENYDMMGQPVESSLHRKVSEIADYIQTHYMEPLTLSHLSKKFYISTYYISRVFKEIIGLSFVEYLNRTRIKEAQRLLGRSGMKIISVSDQVGFDSATHFGRVFKQITGLSPTCYRRLHQEQQEDNKTCQ